MEIAISKATFGSDLEEEVAAHRVKAGEDRPDQTFASRSFSLNPMSTPIRRMRLGCCARAASGHATAVPLSSVMS